MGKIAIAMKDYSVATKALIDHFSKCSGDIDLYEHIKQIVLSGA
jgi:hypothetical protein